MKDPLLEAKGLEEEAAPLCFCAYTHRQAL